MLRASAPTYPTILPVVQTPIPNMIKGSKRWLPWRAGPYKPNGKFDKVPINSLTGHNVSAVDPSNWVSFADALQACSKGMAHGIGIALSDQHPFMVAGEPFFLTAIDLDNCVGRVEEYKQLWSQLGEPYGEVSPSGKGLRMLGLSRTVVRGGNAGDGKELYANGRFVTVTGIGGRGQLCDFTAEIVALEQHWFGNRNSPALPKQGLPVQPAQPQQLEFVKPVVSMLDAVTSDTTYEIWRDIVWSLASTGWQCARQMAHQWSMRAGDRYDAAVLDKLFDSYDPARNITLGTLRHHARNNGWEDRQPALISPLPQSSHVAQSPAPLLMTAHQLRMLPIVPYVVRGVFPAHGLAAIYGEPGSGKSFLALDLAYAIASGVSDWFGFRIRERPVVYVALEGMGGLGKRTTALELHSKKPSPDQLRFWSHNIHLMSGEGIDLLASEIVTTVGKGAVLIIDTLNQASPGADENSSQDMGKIIANSKRLATSLEGLVILVHHSGKSAGKGLRGHSSLLAAMDAVVEVSKMPGGYKNWSITKAKDDSSSVERDFELITYTVGQDDDGTPITSCAVQHAIHATPPKKRLPAGKHQKSALAALNGHLKQPGEGIDYKSATALVAGALDATPGKKGERAKEAVDALLRDGHLTTNELGICLA